MASRFKEHLRTGERSTNIEDRRKESWKAESRRQYDEGVAELEKRLKSGTDLDKFIILRDGTIWPPPSQSKTPQPYNEPGSMGGFFFSNSSKPQEQPMADFDGLPQGYAELLNSARQQLVRRPDGTYVQAPQHGQSFTMDDIYGGIIPPGRGPSMPPPVGMSETRGERRYPQPSQVAEQPLTRENMWFTRQAPVHDPFGTRIANQDQSRLPPSDPRMAFNPDAQNPALDAIANATGGGSAFRGGWGSSGFALPGMNKTAPMPLMPSPQLRAQPGNYTIRKGDTLGAIAKRSGMTVPQIMAINPQIKNANRIRTGGSLNLIGMASAPPPSTNSRTSTSSTRAPSRQAIAQELSRPSGYGSRGYSAGGQMLRDLYGN